MLEFIKGHSKHVLLLFFYKHYMLKNFKKSQKIIYDNNVHNITLSLKNRQNKM